MKRFIPDFRVITAYLGITLVFTYPLVLNFSSHIPGDGGDGLLYFWNLWWLKKALFSLGQILFSAVISSILSVASLGMHSPPVLGGLLALPCRRS